MGLLGWDAGVKGGVGGVAYLEIERTFLWRPFLDWRSTHFLSVMTPPSYFSSCGRFHARNGGMEGHSGNYDDLFS